MKFCIEYDRRYPFNYLNEVDELKINYNKKDDTLLDFLELYKDKTIIIGNITLKDLNLIIPIGKKYKNVKILINLNDQEIYEKLKAEKVNFFFENIVDTWDVLYDIIEKQPTDVYIGNEFGFCLDTIANLLHKDEYHINIRVYPYIAQSSGRLIPDIKKFFIRPEDLDLYGIFIDVCEFMGLEDRNNVFYEIYAHDKYWAGNLNEIIFNFTDEIDNSKLLNNFGYMRLKCHKRCFKGSYCALCENLAELATTLEEKGLMIEIKDK